MFESALLCAVDESAGEPDLLAMLCEAELLVPMAAAGAKRPSHPATRYRFASTMAHDVAYQNLLLPGAPSCISAPARCSKACTARSPARLEDLEALCHHFSQGEDRVRGARYLVSAGDWARGIYANEDALRYYARALDILESGRPRDDAAIGGVREHMGDLLGPIGRRDEARAQFDAVLAVARAQANPVHEARVQRKLAGLHWDAGERERSFTCLREGCSGSAATAKPSRSTSTPASSSPTCARRWGGCRSGPATTRRPSTGPGARCSRRSARPGSAQDDAIHRRAAAAAISHAHNTLGAALARLDRSAEAVIHIERSVTVAQEAGLLQAACRGYANLGVLYATLDPGAPSRPVDSASRPRRRSATSASSRACTRISRSPIARSRSAATTTA